MKSYVREFVNSIASIYEGKRRRDVVRNGVTCRFTTEDYEVMNLVAGHFHVSKTMLCEMLLEQAVYDAAEELGLWRAEENKEPLCEDAEE